jgi:hypothetical protein
VSSRCDADIVLKLLYPTRVSRVGSTETSDEDVNADDEVKLSSPTLLDSRRMNGRLPPPMSIIAELTPNLVPPTSSLYGLLRMISTAWSECGGESRCWKGEQRWSVAVEAPSLSRSAGGCSTRKPTDNAETSFKQSHLTFPHVLTMNRQYRKRAHAIYSDFWPRILR